MQTTFEDDLSCYERSDIARTVTNEPRSTTGKICTELRCRRTQRSDVDQVHVRTDDAGHRAKSPLDVCYAAGARHDQRHDLKGHCRSPACRSLFVRRMAIAS